MKYQPSLDGLRAIAVSAVVFYHLFPSLMPGGWAGVDVFFVLSGFLITAILRAEIDQSGRIDFRRFYLRRFLRLTPAFACLLAAELLMAAIGAGTIPAPDRLIASLVSASYLMNWNGAFHWWPKADLGHTWSLAMEEQFYLLWPVALLCLYRHKSTAWLAAAVVAIGLWRTALAIGGADADRTYHGFDTHADALFIGCLVGLGHLGNRLTTLCRLTAPLALLVLAAILLLEPHRSAVTQSVGLTVNALVAAWLIVGLLQGGVVSRLLSHPILTYTGRISYAWYLWHYPMIVWGLEQSPALRLALLPLSYLIAVLSYHVVERPFLRLKNRLRPPLPPATTLARSAEH